MSLAKVREWDGSTYPAAASDLDSDAEFGALPAAEKVSTLNTLQKQWANTLRSEHPDEYGDYVRDLENDFGAKRRGIVEAEMAKDFKSGAISEDDVKNYTSGKPTDAVKARYGDTEGPWSTYKLPITGADGKSAGFSYVRRAPDDDRVEVSWAVNSNDGQIKGTEDVSAEAAMTPVKRKLAVAERHAELSGDDPIFGPGPPLPRQLEAEVEEYNATPEADRPVLYALREAEGRLRSRPDVSDKVGQGFWAGLPGQAAKGFLKLGAAAYHGPKALTGDRGALREWQEGQEEIESDIEGQSRLGFRGGLMDKVAMGVSEEIVPMVVSMGAGAAGAGARRAATGAMEQAAEAFMKRAGVQSLETASPLMRSLSGGFGKIVGTAQIEGKMARQLADRVSNAVAFLPSSARSGLQNMTETLDAAEAARAAGNEAKAQELEDGAILNGWAGLGIETLSENMWLNEFMVTRSGRKLGDVATGVLSRRLGDASRMARLTGRVKDIAGKMLISGNQEGIEEIVAGIGNREWMNSFADQNKDVTEGIAQEYLTGAVLGAVMGGAKSLAQEGKPEMLAELMSRGLDGNQEAAASFARITGRTPAPPAAGASPTPATTPTAPDPLPEVDIDEIAETIAPLAPATADALREAAATTTESEPDAGPSLSADALSDIASMPISDTEDAAAPEAPQPAPEPVAPQPPAEPAAAPTEAAPVTGQPAGEQVQPANLPVAPKTPADEESEAVVGLAGEAAAAQGIPEIMAMPRLEAPKTKGLLAVRHDPATLGGRVNFAFEGRAAAEEFWASLPEGLTGGINDAGGVSVVNVKDVAGGTAQTMAKLGVRPAAATSPSPSVTAAPTIQPPVAAPASVESITAPATESPSTGATSEGADSAVPRGPAEGIAPAVVSDLPENPPLPDKVKSEKRVDEPAPSGKVRDEIPPQKEDVTGATGVGEEGSRSKESGAPVSALGITSGDPSTVATAIRAIAGNKKSKRHHKRIAADLAPILEQAPVTVDFVRADPDLNGAYDPNTRRVEINLDGQHETSMEETLLHELVHAVTMDAIRNPDTAEKQALVDRVKEQLASARKKADQLIRRKMGKEALALSEEDLLTAVQEQDDAGFADIVFGTRDIDEFSARAMTSAAFQKFMRGIYPEGGEKSLWDKFIEAVAALFGKESAALATEAYATLLKLAPVKPAARTETPTTTEPPAPAQPSEVTFGTEYAALEQQLRDMPKVRGKSMLDHVRRLRAKGETFEKVPKLKKIVDRMAEIERESGEEFTWIADDVTDDAGAEIAGASGGALLSPSTAPAAPIAPLKSQSEIIRDIARAFRIPIRFGRLTTNRFAGYFKALQDLIGVKRANDIPTVAHEAGHKLDAMFNFSSDPRIAAELDVLGNPATAGSRSSWTKSKTVKYRRGEGVGEFIRYWLTEPATASRMAPATEAYFNDILDANPDLAASLRQIQGDIHNWRNAPAAARMASQISVGSNPNKTRYGLSQLTRDLVDDLHILRLVADDVQRESGPLAPSDNFYMNARLLRGSFGMAGNFIQRGVANFRTKAVTLGTGLEDALKPVAGRLNDFRLWIIAKRAQELQRQGKETGFVPSDVDEVAAAHDADPVFQKSFADVKTWQDAVLQYAVDAGYVSEESAEAMRNMHKDYVPFHRIFEIGAGESPSQESGGIGRGLNVGKAGSLKRLTGSTRDIVDPIETMIKNAYAFITAAEKSAVAAQIGALSKKEGAGKWVEEIATPKENVRVQLESVRKQLEAAGADLTGVPDELLMTFFQNSKTAPFGENIIKVTSRGKTTFYRLNKDLFDTFHSLNDEDSNTLIRILSSPAQLLRAGVTLDPSFGGANLFRDAFGSAVINKYGLLPFQAAARGVAALMGNPKIVAEWSASGGEQTFESIYFDRKKLAKFIRDRITKDLTKAQQALVWTGHPLMALRWLAGQFEMVTRIGEYKTAYDKSLAAGMPAGDARRQAAFESRDRQDFAVGGAKTKPLRHAAAFWNAGLQGNAAVYRAFKERPVRTTLQGLAFVTSVSMALMAKNYDDDDYWETPQWQRDVFWMIPIGKDANGHTRFLRLPKPFVIGTIFGTLPERIAASARKNKRAFDGLAATFAENTIPNPIPNFAIMIAEPMIGDRGWVFWRRNEIVPEALEGFLPEYQITEQTSLTARKIGALKGWSPMKIDHFIRSATGGLGKQIVHNIIDWGISIATGEKPTAQNTNPFGRFFSTPAGINSESVDRFYKQIEPLKKKKASITVGGPELTADENVRLNRMEAAGRVMSKLRKQARRTSDPTERQRLYLRITERAKHAIE